MLETHLVMVQRQSKSSVGWYRVAIVFYVSTFFQLVQVEHFIKAIIIVGDGIKDHMTIILESVHVMVDDHCPCVVFCLNLFARLPVYQVNQSLFKK